MADNTAAASRTFERCTYRFVQTVLTQVYLRLPEGGKVEITIENVRELLNIVVKSKDLSANDLANIERVSIKSYARKKRQS